MSWHGGALLLVFIAAITVILAQDNASPKIPAHLIECYRNQSIYHRANRLPMTLRTFLDLVRQVESSPTGRNLNAREIAASLTYFLRMDGIEPSPVSSSVSNDESVVPFAPMGEEFFRHRLMLVRLLSKPNQQDYRFLTENLTTKEMCNLHFMLSYSMDSTKRFDERCDIKQESYSRGGRYRRATKKNRKSRKDRRQRRQVEKEEEDVDSQVETLPPHVVEALENSTSPDNKTSQFTVGKQDLLAGGYGGYDGPLRGGINRNVVRKVERGMTPSSYNPRGFTPNVERSSCPVQNGVILTPYGSVNMGSVVAGITAGLQPQDISPTQLGVLQNELSPSVGNVRVNNLWAVTLGGDLADMLLDVGKLEDINNAVGLRGGWNNTISPKWYLLSSDQTAYVTDPQLRGSIDGLWLGTSVKSWSDRMSNLKLSQIIDGYYSPNGIPGTSVKACNRKLAFNQIAPDLQFSQQLEIFSIVMSKQRLSTATITDYTALVQNTITNVKQYIQSFDVQTQCLTTVASSDQTGSTVDYSLNLAVVIDSTWPFETLRDILNLLIEKEVVASPYSSNTTIICGKDGRIIYQGINAVSFAANFTVDNINNCAVGFDMMQSLYAVEVVFRQLYELERSTGRVNKGAYAALLLPYSSSGLLNADSSAVTDKIRDFNTTLPDVKIFVATNGPKDAFNKIVNDPNNDIFTIRAPSPDDSSTVEQIDTIAYALRGLSQRLAYPQCGSYFTQKSSSRGTLIDNVRVGYTKFYRLRANYFYTVSNTPKITIRATRSSQLSVCVSRTDPMPTGDPPTSGGDPRNQIPQDPYYPQSPSYPQSPNFPQNPQPNQNSYNRGYQNNRRNSWNGAYTAYGRQVASDAKCISVTSSAAQLELPSDPCGDYSYIFRCPPIYVSVTAPTSTTLPPGQCINDCRLPTNAEYEFGLENLSCDSGATDILSSPITILLTSLLLALYAMV